MTNHRGLTKHMALQVRDQEGTAYTIRLMVAEQNETGALSILTPAGGVVRQFELSHLKKSRDGSHLSCYVSGATATLSLKRDKNPPALHVSASLFVPIFEAVYSIDPTEQERFTGWMTTLSIGISASS